MCSHDLTGSARVHNSMSSLTLSVAPALRLFCRLSVRYWSIIPPREHFLFSFAGDKAILSLLNFGSLCGKQAELYTPPAVVKAGRETGAESARLGFTRAMLLITQSIPASSSRMSHNRNIVSEIHLKRPDSCLPGRYLVRFTALQLNSIQLYLYRP